MSSLADDKDENLNKNDVNDQEKQDNFDNKDKKENDNNEIRRKIEGIVENLFTLILEFKCLKKKNNETLEQFLFRGKIFLNVYEDTKDEVTALKFSNIWVNILALNCSYQKDVMELVEKYKPSEEENIYKNPLEN